MSKRPAPFPWDVAVAVTLASGPAYANNGPMPDAWLALAAIAPLGILVFRLSGASLEPAERSLGWTIARGLTLTFALIVAAGGTAFSLPACIFAPAIAIRWSWRAMARGSSRSRWFLGPPLILFSLVAPVAMVASMAYSPRHRANEHRAWSTLTRLATCEKTFRSESQPFVPLSELSASCGIEPEVVSGQAAGYRYSLEVIASKDGGQPASFWAAAVPVRYGPPPAPLFYPRLFAGAAPSGQLSFFVDESGRVRAKDNGGKPPATPSEGAAWE